MPNQVSSQEKERLPLNRRMLTYILLTSTLIAVLYSAIVFFFFKTNDATLIISVVAIPILGILSHFSKIEKLSYMNIIHPTKQI